MVLDGLVVVLGDSDVVLGGGSGMLFSDVVVVLGDSGVVLVGRGHLASF